MAKSKKHTPKKFHHVERQNYYLVGFALILILFAVFLVVNSFSAPMV